MRFSIERLRAGIVVLSALLVAVIVGLFFYARYQMHRFVKDLPGKLGVSIQQSTNGFTISREEKGHTVFTVHASKAVQYKGGGRTQLHDVAITLYGPQGSNRLDRIYGTDFDYDPANSTVATQGEVEIDLENPGSDQSQGQQPSGSRAAGSDQPPADGQPSGASDRPTEVNTDADSGTIHVKTVGLVFNQKTGIATTDKGVEFHFPKAAGTANGAEYDSKQGTLVLDRSVELSSSVNGNSVLIHASHAQLVRSSHQVFLLSPTCDFENIHNSSDEGIVYFRPDGSAGRIHARGNVRIKTDTGENVVSQVANVQLDQDSQPTQADMGGGVFFESVDALHHMRGNAIEGTLRFGPESTLKHAQLRNAVSFVDQLLSLPNDPRGNATREVRSSTLDVDFALGADGRAQAQKALAVGDAVVVLHTIPSKGPQQNTTISGDQLLATLANGNAITRLDGTGHTKIVDLAANGATNTTTGDTLAVNFTPPEVQKAAKPVKGSRGKPASLATAGAGSQVESALQQGHVVIVQTPPPPAATNAPSKSGQQTPSTPLHATAERAEYHAGDQVLHLEGNPRVDNGGLNLSADHVAYHRDSGDATASGNVKATYVQQGSKPSAPSMGGQGPSHVIADRADLTNTTGLSVFRGNARLWQGTNSVAAPVIELSRPKQTLAAHGDDPASQAAVVNAALVTSMASSHAPSGAHATHQQAVVRVHSREMFYSDGERKGNFKGSVVAEDPNGTIHSDETEFYLKPAAPAGAKRAPSPKAAQTGHSNPAPDTAAKDSASSELDRLVATGHVVLTQPGRRGVGDKLVYTEEDGNYVLTGSAQNPPKVFDQVHGTVTGASLLFHGQDDSVTVNGGQSSAVTETHARK
jgi:lipopolysaccharide export system protein LptA